MFRLGVQHVVVDRQYGQHRRDDEQTGTDDHGHVETGVHRRFVLICITGQAHDQREPGHSEQARGPGHRVVDPAGDPGMTDIGAGQDGGR